ncbi:hypothetical protein BK704_13580 [[Bacillus thuringiensis] serovar konkukian]|nr:hypothetical protein [Bacillus thuringiensis]ANN35454.1 hypothetical protein A9498_28920 [Bacillus thuringiensis serovar coreanensis]MED1302972.1 hypothetical protein [Bacillus pacificus]OUB07541.1 hypothetical protein BK704_13580 [[Bacillus thuringiensis] serovar konkukian]
MIVFTLLLVHDVSAFIGNEDVGNDAIVYKVGENPSGEPNQFSPKWQHTYNYGTLPIEEIWAKKYISPPYIFEIASFPLYF